MGGADADVASHAFHIVAHSGGSGRYIVLGSEITLADPVKRSNVGRRREVERKIFKEGVTGCDIFSRRVIV
jgi:hypothetical protein